jgi:predicted alpha/beta hydrolase family esterase
MTTQRVAKRRIWENNIFNNWLKTLELKNDRLKTVTKTLGCALVARGFTK